MSRPARVLVCGAVYGSSYLRALSGGFGGGAGLAGVLGRGGPASRGHAERLRVPYFTGPEQVPAGAVDAVCVAVGGAAGVALAHAFLDRGLPVLSEHPMDAATVAGLQRAAASRGVPWHLNAHFADLPTIQPLVTGCRRLLATSPPLFVHATANPRTLYSLVDLLARAVGLPDEPSWSALPLADERRDFLVTVAGSLGGASGKVSASISCQRTVSAHDDGSATLVSHHVEVGFPGGVLELADTCGPVIWRPDLAATAPGEALWSTWPAGPPPTLTSFQAQRDAANHAAVLALLAQARGATAPGSQHPTHQLAVARTWDAVVAAVGPPVVVGAGP